MPLSKMITSENWCTGRGQLICNGLLFEAVVTSGRQWRIQRMKTCSVDCAGHDIPLVLLSSVSSDRPSSTTDVCIIQMSWQALQQKSATVVPLMQFSCEDVQNICEYALLDGPSVLVITSDGRLLLYADEGALKVQRKDFAFDLGDTLDVKHSSNDRTNTVELLAVESGEEWVVVILSASAQGTVSTVPIALDKCKVSKEYKVRQCTDHFFPSDYSPKIKMVTFQSCIRTIKNHASVFQSKCAVGLSDGFIMVFKNCEMQSCVPLWPLHKTLQLQGFAFRQVLFLNNVILICHVDSDDSQECVALNSTNGHVLLQQCNVREAVVDDFVHSGSKQLLMLHNGDRDCSGEKYPSSSSSYCLTDLQGVVGETGDSFGNADLSEKRPHCAALQEQCHGLSRRVAEEEDKVARKKTLASAMWRHLCLQSH